MILRKVLRAKIHGVRVTGKNVHYEGSITIGRELLVASGILPGEEVLVANVSNGERFTTYVIPGESREIVLNGAAARKGEVGDELIIFAWAYVTEDEAKRVTPTIVIVDEQNRVKRRIELRW